MLDNIPEEYEIDPGTDIDRLAEIFLEQYPDAIRRDVEDAIFVDDGPVDYLAWIALEDYSRHEIFYYDTAPDSETLQQLLLMSPSEDEMDLLRAYFASRFDTVEEIAHVAFLEVPDKYLPGSKPSANVSFYQNAVGTEVNIGLNATPIQQEEKILADVDRLVPASDLQTFAENVVRTFYDDIRKTAKQHLLEGDIEHLLSDDAAFRHQTTKPLPAGLHPAYTDETAALWQKPVSKEPAIEASEGFVQVWVPVSEETLGFVTLTDGDYDRETAQITVQNALSERL